MFTNGATLREAKRLMTSSWNNCLCNEARELESVHKEGKVEILRYSRARGHDGHKKGALVYIHTGGLAFGPPEDLSGFITEFATQTSKQLFLIRYQLESAPAEIHTH